MFARKSMNILLTGEKKVGKSTIISDFLDSYNGKVTGFITQKRPFTPENKGIFIFDVNDKGKVANPSCLVGLCGKSKILERYESPFETIGVHTLSDPNCDIIIMDEIGLIEKDAQNFKKHILHNLNSNIPVLGVIKYIDDVFLNAIRQREDTILLKVERYNRRKIMDKIKQMLSASPNK